MRTTIDIPEELINEAMKITNSSTKTELVKTALKNIIQKNRISGLKKYKGKISLDINLDDIRERNERIS